MRSTPMTTNEDCLDIEACVSKCGRIKTGRSRVLTRHAYL